MFLISFFRFECMVNFLKKGAKCTVLCTQSNRWCCLHVILPRLGRMGLPWGPSYYLSIAEICVRLH